MERKFYSLQINKTGNVKKQPGITADFNEYFYCWPYPLTLRLAGSLHWHLLLEGQRDSYISTQIQYQGIALYSQSLISYGFVTWTQAAFMDFLILDKTQVSFQSFSQQAITLDRFTLLPIFST